MLWFGIWGVWTVLALMSASQTALTLASRGQVIMWTPLLVLRLADWYTCAIFTPPLLWLARRYPLEGGVWKRHLPIHVAASIVAVLLKYAIYVPLVRLITHADASMRQVLAANILTESMFIWATIGAIHTIEFYRRYRERESLAHRLSAELSKAQLDALRAQLHPHFLFNTLNAIATLVHTDPDAADDMIARLSGLLRASLQYSGDAACTLADELVLARTYADIMCRRFAERVAVEWSTPDELASARVPAFLLQPLLENAFEHGTRLETNATTNVVVHAERVGADLKVSVSDDGRGLSPEDMGGGIGLDNTRHRLAALYGAAASLIIGPGKNGGTIVTATIPYAR
jgi:two-component system, LytTR family, sensor kinase